MARTYGDVAASYAYERGIQGTAAFPVGVLDDVIDALEGLREELAGSGHMMLEMLE